MTKASISPAAGPQAVGGWQDIATAPRDGTAVLVANTDGAWIAHWAPIAVSGYRFSNPWRSLMLNHYHIGEPGRYAPATHWMPLPAPPESAP